MRKASQAQQDQQKVARYKIALQKAYADNFPTSGGWQSVKVSDEFAVECMRAGSKPKDIVHTMVEA